MRLKYVYYRTYSSFNFAQVTYHKLILIFPMYYIVQNAAVYFSEGILDWCTWNICAALQELFRNVLLIWVKWYWWNHFVCLIFIKRKGSSGIQGTRTALLFLHLSTLLHWLITELFIFLHMNVTFINGCMFITTLSYLINMFQPYRAIIDMVYCTLFDY
jgi:hypothetical protein